MRRAEYKILKRVGKCLLAFNLFFMVCFVSGFKSRFRSRHGASYFVPSDKKTSVKTYDFASFHFRGAKTQSTLLYQRSERSHNHRQSSVVTFLFYYFCSPLKWFSALCLSVIIPFLLSASRSLFSHISASRKVHINPRRSTLLSPAESIVCHASLSLPFTISLLDSRWSLLCAFL